MLRPLVIFCRMFGKVLPMSFLTDTSRVVPNSSPQPSADQTSAMRVPKTRYGEGGTVHFESDPHGGTVLQIIAADGEIDAIATIDLSQQGARRLAPNEVWLKGWAENVGLPLALEKAGIVRVTGETFELQSGSGRFEAELAELTPNAIAARDVSQRAHVVEPQCTLAADDFDTGATKRHAEAGDVASQALLGSYCRSIGKFDEAESWLRRAADMNHRDAIFELGMLYLRSDAAHENSSKAHDLFLRGLRAKDGMAAANLAVMYASGMGVSRSLPIALSYSLLAHDLGNADAPALSARISRELGRSERVAADGLLLKLRKELDLP